MRDWAAINHPKHVNDKVAYNFPAKRECHWCKQQKHRTSGRWVTKEVWLCKPCQEKESEND